jgi:uncharacterized RDD family membrane protein YckC/DNA-binding HxlR family transcriptional regulator
MAVEQKNISKIISNLAHALRREILLNLSEKGELSFTDLLNILNVDTGKLSFHLRSLEAFIEQTPTGKYKLSRTGENAVRVIRDVEGWAEVADVQRTENQLPLASFRKRAAAYAINFAIIFAITNTIIFLPQVLSLSADTFLKGGISTMLFTTIGLYWLYSTIFEGFSGQTLGKVIMGLKVVRTDGKKLSYEHAAVRNFGKILPLLPFDLFIGWRIPNNRFKRYFDKYAGTTVIDLRHQPEVGVVKAR